MNRVGKATWKDGECLINVILEQACIFNSDFMQEVSSFIDSEDSNATIKIKNFNLLRSTMAEKDRYRQFMESLAEIRKRRNKLTILLEAGPQALPSAVLGFDIVSTSMRALDRGGKFGKSKAKGWGGYYDRKWLIVRSIFEVREMFENNGHKLSCPCPACKPITSLEEITKDFWNASRRKHYLFTMDDLMEELRQHVRNRRIELAFNRINDSELCPLKKLIPSY